MNKIEWVTPWIDPRPLCIYKDFNYLCMPKNLTGREKRKAMRKAILHHYKF